MLINSLTFLLFFGVVFCVYYFFLNGKPKAQNVLLLLASYCFYGFAELRMLPLLVVVTLIYYLLGKVAGDRENEKRASWCAVTGVILGVGMLDYFKYFNFFVDSFARFFNALGWHCNAGTFNIIMPLGISFFTFKLISYVLEVHRCRIGAERDLVSFATYVAFFPTIMSGPIDRPNTFLPQLHTRRDFNYAMAVDGCRQILWGMFKKMVIADNLALAVNPVWENISGYSGSTLLYTAILYAFQLYADFSGYSDMAIGVGKLLGFRITINFRYPYFATNIAEYWRRWHISLTGWLTDYVFMPLNIRFRDYGKWGLLLAILINMIVVGLWHGASWTFVVFGVYHGLLFIPLVFSGKFSKKEKLKTGFWGLPSGKDFLKMTGTFLLVMLGAIIFRAPDSVEAWHYAMRILTASLFSFPVLAGKAGLLFTVIMFVWEWKFRDEEYPLQMRLHKQTVFWRYTSYFFLLLVIYFFSAGSETFIYFQF